MKRIIISIAIAALLLTAAVAAFAAESSYSDVSADAWYAKAVAALREKGIMDGVGGNRFDPDGIFTRAQLATVLYRLAGEPYVSGEDGFTDTAAGTWYSDAVLWASQNGVVNGYGNGLFGTTDPATQEQLAVMLWRDAGSDVSGEDARTENGAERGASDWAADAVRWASAEGLLTDAVAFEPTSAASRAQVADMVYRYLLRAESAEIRQTTVKEVVVSFDFTRMSTHASNQFAVWVEDADGNMVKTIFVPDFTAARRGYRLREDAVPSWVSAANPDAMTDQEIDAISSATPRAGAQQFTWDMTDAKGNPVPDGVYKIMVEGTLYWSSTVLYTAELDSATAAAGELPVTERRSEPDNKENEGMIQSVHVTMIAAEVA